MFSRTQSVIEKPTSGPAFKLTKNLPPIQELKQMKGDLTNRIANQTTISIQGNSPMRKTVFDS